MTSAHLREQSRGWRPGAEGLGNWGRWGLSDVVQGV